MNPFDYRIRSRATTVTAKVVKVFPGNYAHVKFNDGRLLPYVKNLTSTPVLAGSSVALSYDNGRWFIT